MVAQGARVLPVPVPAAAAAAAAAAAVPSGAWGIVPSEGSPLEAGLRVELDGLLKDLNPTPAPTPTPNLTRRSTSSKRLRGRARHGRAWVC